LGAGFPAYGALARIQYGYLASTAEQIDRSSLLAMLAVKNAHHLKAVLQLPVLGWPEALPQRKLTAYNHLLPFVLDDPRTGTRWSYGAVPFEPAFITVSRIAADPTNLTSAARQAGFEAILVEKAAYDDPELNSLTTAIESSVVRACRIFDDPQRILYALQCASTEDRK
jgi:hypothetical protein